MKSKRFIILAIMMALFIGLAAVSYAATDDASDDAVGTVTKIAGLKVTVKESSGTEKTVEVKDLKGLKVGDYVIIDDSKVKKINAEKKKGLDIK